MTIYFLTFERYLSILHPVIHRLYVTKAQVLACVCCAAMYVITAGPVLTIISAKAHKALSAATVWLVLAFNTFAYIRIYFAVKNMHFRRTASVIIQQNRGRHHITWELKEIYYENGTLQSLVDLWY